MDLPFQATIACQSNKGMCDDNIVTAPDFISAVNEWNEKQECDIDG